MSGLGIKPISKFGSERLIRAAIKYALDHKRESVNLVHKGNIMKYTEGAFMKWGYDSYATSSPTSRSAGTTAQASLVRSCSSKTPSPTSPFSRC